MALEGWKEFLADYACGVIVRASMLFTKRPVPKNLISKYSVPSGELNITVPIDYYPTLALATKAERNKYEIFPVSVYWPALDADIGVEGLLLGAKEHPARAEKAVLRAQRRGILPKPSRSKAA